MKRLIIDTATRACSVALFDGGECVASCYEDIGRGHAERLVPMIAELPDKGRADAIHVNVGPGSFTGIRVGVSAARALALAWGAECHGYACLQLVAAMAVESGKIGDAFTVVTVGGHGEYFLQSFGADRTPSISMPIDRAVAELTSETIVGDAAEPFVAARGWGTAMPILPDARSWPLLSADAPLAPSPIYGRGADAKLPGGINP